MNIVVRSRRASGEETEDSYNLKYVATLLTWRSCVSAAASIVYTISQPLAYLKENSGATLTDTCEEAL